MGLGVFVVLVAGVGYMVYRTGGVQGTIPSENIATSTTTSSDTINLGNGLTVDGLGGATIEQLPATPAVQAPSLSRTISYSTSLPPEAVETIKTKIADIRTQLKATPTRGDLWLQLGLYYKIAGDFRAAEEVWVYLTKAIPQDYTAHQNLGDLYQNFLKDYPKAEAEYLAVVRLKPEYIDAYRSLYTMYRYQYKTGTTAAKDIVEKGLVANPGNSDLLKMRAELSNR